MSETEVFKDRTPRLTDLNADGRTEIITIWSSVSAGAAASVYGLLDGEIRHLATGLVGTPNRSLNITGIAPFRGRQGLEIADVRTPHIGGTLIFHALDGTRLVENVE